MDKLVGGIVLELRRTLSGELDDPPRPLRERLLRAYAGYFVAAIDAEESVWGAAGMCFVSLAVFAETISKLRKEAGETAVPGEGITDVIEAAMVDAELSVDNPGEE